MTAAFCLAGEPRSFIVPAVYLSIQHNLIEAFGATGDVFAYLRVGSGACSVHARQAARSSGAPCMQAALQPRRAASFFLNKHTLTVSCCSVHGLVG